jgi:HK97 gp10 family phage protein
MVTIEVKGLKELQANVNKLPQRLKQETSGVLERGAQLFVRNAKRDAPVDFDFLRNLISYAKTGELKFTLISGSKYSPYLEWGTITRVSVPTELASYAIQFKGKGIRKNGGIFPHPYFYKQQIPVKIEMEKNLEPILKDIKL